MELKRDNLQKLADALRALGNPTRLRIVEKVQQGHYCVKDLQRDLDQTQPSISQHLTVLKDRGILTPERRGNLTCYHLADERTRDLLELAKRIFGSREGEDRKRRGSRSK